MAVVDLSFGGATALPVGTARLSQFEYKLDLSAEGQSLADGNVLRLIDLPVGCVPLAASAEVVTADDVTGATVDLGIYAASNNAEIDKDCLLGELAIDATGAVYQTPAAGVNLTAASYIGLSRGDGGSTTTFETGEIWFSVLVADMNIS